MIKKGRRPTIQHLVQCKHLSVVLPTAPISGIRRDNASKRWSYGTTRLGGYLSPQKPRGPSPSQVGSLPTYFQTLPPDGFFFFIIFFLFTIQGGFVARRHTSQPGKPQRHVWHACRLVIYIYMCVCVEAAACSQLSREGQGSSKQEGPSGAGIDVEAERERWEKRNETGR